ncbi:MAG TPA: TlpA disulfide reductase family protein [Flavobacterium sp.]|jgi:peroxiredoxin|uniref:TlpA family protein disulfide reductase n=1 Tax=Flavobacterium sp. TaxID=239 RepID=UPI002C7DE726|nr:TlpA disulfide reductase family protein [Flavobacterium sp.]HPW97670.1 TlpA disulfide reductase family protein [Flavobacterium sp.]HQA73345.1 TlpA disulfide reductase family protein [Flavobacterium sp.]
MKNLVTLFLIFAGIIAYSQTKMPDVSLSDIDGKKVSIKNDFNEKDKIYVFSFWATWCTPCINELDEMNDVKGEWTKNLNIEIIAVATDDSRTQKRIKPLVNGKGWDYKILLDSNQDLKRALSIVNIPYTVVVKNGEIVHIQNGYVPGSEDELYTKLKTL